MEFCIEKLGGSANLAAGDVQSAEFAGDLGDFSHINALDVHLGDCPLFDDFGEGPFSANAPFEAFGIELDTTCLRHLQLDLADARLERFGLAAFRKRSAGAYIQDSLGW